MKRFHSLFKPVAARVLAAAVLVATSSLLSGPAVAAAEPTSASRIEARIHDMHAKLAITAEQEGQWKQVAQVMRDNESAIEPLVQDRKANAGTMTAIDDLKSYAAITDAHLEGIKRFTTAFATLYDSMSEAQKKDADALFRKGSQQKMLKAK
jgi:outer membrane lipoprotein-sorting protein